IDDFTDTTLIFLIHTVALGIAHLLHDDLLGRLGGDAAEFHGRERLSEEVANLGGGIFHLSKFERHLTGRFFDLVNNFEQAPHAGLTRTRIDLDLDLGLGAIAALGGLFHRVLHSLDHDHAVDGLFAGDSV